MKEEPKSLWSSQACLCQEALYPFSLGLWAPLLPQPPFLPAFCPSLSSVDDPTNQALSSRRASLGCREDFSS